MKEYIERATVLNLLEKINPVDFGSMFDYEAHGAVQECLREISYGVEDISAADVAEVRHGRWEWKEEWETHPETHSCDLISCGWYCHNCGIELGEYLTKKTGRYVCLDDDFCEPTLGICPNCGARMDEEDK